MGPKAKQEYLEAVRERYLRANCREKKRIRDEFCETVGCHRKSAVRMLNSLRRDKPARPGPKPLYAERSSGCCERSGWPPSSLAASAWSPPSRYTAGLRSSSKRRGAREHGSNAAIKKQELHASACSNPKRWRRGPGSNSGPNGGGWIRSPSKSNPKSNQEKYTSLKSAAMKLWSHRS